MKAAYPHCADRLFGRALAIEPNALRTIIEGPVGRRILSGERIEDAEVMPGAKATRTKRLAMTNAIPVRVADGCGEYALTDEGIAIVSVMGVLSQRFDWLAALCGWTTYEGLAATFDAMLTDYRVRGILMDVDSPGGEAAGMPDAADLILAARAQKPVWAVANTFAASAAYAIAGAAGKLYVPRLALVGSIGAVCVHVDQSAQDAAYGERYTAIYSGARKIDGWEHAALSADAKASFQAGVDHCRDQFAELVGNQGRMTKAQAIATEAAIYHDQEAVEAGLADRVGSFDQALADLTAELNENSTRAAGAASTQETGMSKIVQNGAARGKGGASTAALNLQPRADAADGDAERNTDDDRDETGEDVDPDGDGDDDADGKEEKTEMVPPKPGEKCALCGQTMAEDGGNTDPDSPEEAHVAHLDIAAQLADVNAILDLCASQSVSLSEARGFIKSKTSLADVRKKIAASKAAASDALEFDTRQPEKTNNTEARVTQMREAQAAVKKGLKSRFAK